MDSSDKVRDPLTHPDQPTFVLWSAPILSPVVGENSHEMGKHIPTSPKPLVHVLHEAQLSAQDTIQKLKCENKSLKEENSSLAMKGLSISESLEQLKRLYSEKEEMRVQMKEMDANFQRERKAMQDLNSEKTEEICDLRTQVLVFQSRDIQMQEEVRKCEEKWLIRVQQLKEEVKEPKKELSDSMAWVEKQILSLEETARLLRDEGVARLSAQKEHDNKVMQLVEEKAATRLKECEDKWQKTARQLEDEIQKTRRELSESRTHIVSLKETVHVLNEEVVARISTTEDHYKVLIQAKEEEAATKLRECEEMWLTRLRQLEEELDVSKRDLFQSMTQKETLTAKLGETDRLLKEECSARISASEEHYEEAFSTLKDTAHAKLRECEGIWQMKVEQLKDELEVSKCELKVSRTQMESISSSVQEILRHQRAAECPCMKKVDEIRKLETCVEKIEMMLKILEGEVKNQKELVNCLFNIVKKATADSRNPQNQSVLECQELQEKFRKQLVAQEESWKRRLLELEREKALANQALGPAETDLSGLISGKQKKVSCWLRRFKISTRKDDSSAPAEYKLLQE